MIDKQKMKTMGTVLMLLFSSVMMLSFIIVPSVVADTSVTVTGNFTSTGTLSAEVNDTTPDFGNISTGASSEVKLQVNNTGSTTIDVSHDAIVEDSGADLSVGSAGGLAADEYSVELDNDDDGASYTDVGSGSQTLANDIAVSGNQAYRLKVTLSSSVTKQYPAAEAFSADLTVSEGGT